LPQLLQLPGELLRADLLCPHLLRPGSDLQLHASDRIRAGHQLRAGSDLQLRPDVQLRSYLQLPDDDLLLPANLQLLLVQLLPFVRLELPPFVQLQLPQVSCQGSLF
jgi:hypothetical protein